MEVKEFFSILRTKEQRDQIIKLYKEKKYDDIYLLYGRTIYNLIVPHKYAKKDIKKLMSEQKFEDVFQKYGQNEYNKHLAKMRAIDVYYETGIKSKSISHKVKYKLFRQVMPCLMSGVVVFSASMAVSIPIISSKEIAKNATKYAKEIEDYNSKIEDYAKHINGMKLNDTQIIMKVVSDMWKEIEGYGTPSKDIAGYYRLDFLGDNKIGVCRNMADDVTAKLNAINPEYNARNFVVYLESNEWIIADINRNIVETNDTVVNDEQKTEENQSENFFENTTKIFGNHMVTAIDVPNENLTLIIDPTNPSIGVFRNGKIHMFSTPDGKGLTVKSAGMAIQGVDSIINLPIAIGKSFLQSEKSFEELELIYGTKAQNEALEYLKVLENNSYVENENKRSIMVNELRQLRNSYSELDDNQQSKTR